MAKKSSVKFDIEKLEVLATGLKKLDDGKFKIQVGLFGDKNIRKDEKNDGLTNAEVGYKNEMGSVTERIPRRSFLWDTFTQHFKELEDEIKDKKLVEKYLQVGKLDDYLKKVGSACENLVKKSFQTGGWGNWKPNAPLTIKLKGSAQPLIDKGELWQAVTSRTVKS
jgi:hypothetical protein